MDRHQQTFLEEARDLLAELEQALLAIERDPQSAELIGRIFRVMHTVKGSSGMFGFTDIQRFTHELENAFDLIRQGQMVVTPPLISLTLISRDHIANLLDCAEVERPPDAGILQGGERILERLRTLLPAAAATAKDVTPASAPAPEAVPPLPASVFRIRFVPPRNILLTGTDPQHLLEELKAMGECVIVLHPEQRPPEQERDPDLCYDRWDILLSGATEEHAIRDVFIFVEDESEIRIEALGPAARIDHALWQKLVEALHSAEDVPHAALKAIVESSVVAGREVAPAAVRPADGPHADRVAHSIKVPSERLDKLVDLVGELVIVQARLTQKAATSRDPALQAIAEEVESLIWELRDSAMSIRMLPIGTMFGKFRRLVRDLSAELHKEIELETEGEETELDKTVIERLSDPIVHMIRNSIDHGVEAPDDRVRAGKPRTGTIRLSARHVGASVHIGVGDDGRGLDTDAIRKKAIQQGLIAAGSSPTERELFALIFRAGFSTAKTVSNVSGRGVGMDVVRRNIEELGGQIEVSSSIGNGTTITLKLPLTLAIVEGLLVSVAGDFYVVPLAVVKECVELTEETRRRSTGGDIIGVRGEIIPYVRLREFYGRTGSTPPIEYVVITEINEMAVGLAVDAVLGQHQIVVKPLGTVYRNVRDISGATILGDGTVALITDVSAILAHVQGEASKKT